MDKAYIQCDMSKSPILSIMYTLVYMEFDRQKAIYSMAIPRNSNRYRATIILIALRHVVYDKQIYIAIALFAFCCVKYA